MRTGWDLTGGAKAVTLDDVFPLLKTACEQQPDLPAPRLYLGPGLPAFDLCRNAAYQELSYTFTGYLAQLVRELWNNSKPRALTTEQIREHGAGAYGNHRKLSFAPWDLIADGDQRRERRLTERGALFAKGQLKIPRTIRATSDETTDPSQWEASPGSDEISINDV